MLFVHNTNPHFIPGQFWALTKPLTLLQVTFTDSRDSVGFMAWKPTMETPEEMVWLLPPSEILCYLGYQQAFSWDELRVVSSSGISVPRVLKVGDFFTLDRGQVVCVSAVVGDNITLASDFRIPDIGAIADDGTLTIDVWQLMNRSVEEEDLVTHGPTTNRFETMLRSNLLDV